MTDDPRLPSPESSNEPTVLDLFKSVTKDWKSFFNFIASVFNDERRAEVERKIADGLDKPGSTGGVSN